MRHWVEMWKRQVSKWAWSVGGDVWGGDLNSRAVGKWVVFGYGLNETKGWVWKEKGTGAGPGAPTGKSERRELSRGNGYGDRYGAAVGKEESRESVRL